jgi:hypothetical protein
MAAADANGKQLLPPHTSSRFLQSAVTAITCQQLEVGRAGMISLPL